MIMSELCVVSFLWLNVLTFIKFCIVGCFFFFGTFGTRRDGVVLTLSEQKIRCRNGSDCRKIWNDMMMSEWCVGGVEQMLFEFTSIFNCIQVMVECSDYFKNKYKKLNFKTYSIHFKHIILQSTTL
jgi:hypothetical protein